MRSACEELIGKIVAALDESLSGTSCDYDWRFLYQVALLRLHTAWTAKTIGFSSNAIVTNIITRPHIQNCECNE